MKTTPHELMTVALDLSIERYKIIISNIVGVSEDKIFFDDACGRLEELAGIDDATAQQLRSDSNYAHCPCCYASAIIAASLDAPAPRHKCQYCPIIKAVNKGIVDAKHYQYCKRVPIRSGDPEFFEFLEDLKTIRSWWGVENA